MISFNIARNQVTPLIRVSTAALQRADETGEYWLVETWIFSDDSRQANRQIIHGTSGRMHSPCIHLQDKAVRIHGYIASNLLDKFRPEAILTPNDLSEPEKISLSCLTGQMVELNIIPVGISDLVNSGVKASEFRQRIRDAQRRVRAKLRKKAKKKI